MNIKAHIAAKIGVLIIIGSIGLTSCKTANNVPKSKEEQIGGSFIESDSEQEVNKKYSTSEKKPIVNAIGYSEEDMTFTLEELKAEAELIIYGEVIDYASYFPDAGFIVTTEFVEVEECIYGEFDKGDVIEIDRSSGIVLIQDYIDSYEVDERENVKKTKFKGLSQEQIANEYISQSVTGESDIFVGKKAIFYLVQGESNKYRRLGESQGEYVEIEKGKFKKPNIGNFEDFLEATSEKESERILENNETKLLDENIPHYIADNPEDAPTPAVSDEKQEVFEKNQFVFKYSDLVK